jgi:signal transduction histidine kinase
VSELPTTPETVDGNLMTIALQNLLINAAQAQRRGTITVSLQPVKRLIQLVIADSGPGIPAQTACADRTSRRDTGSGRD